MGSSPSSAAAGDPLLETKLYAPKWRPGQVSRPRLIARLDQGAQQKLTLVSAPAGFGKSTLLAEWLAATPAGDRPAAWVSLDERDNDPARFWAYVVTALRKVRPGVGERALSLLGSPQPPPIEAILTTVVNEVAATEGSTALVLDDLHAIEAEPIHEALAFLIDHLPPRLHLVLASRSDPPLPLARLRGRGQSTELRAADLRFTPGEVAAFLTGAMGLQLSPGDVAALEARTEGWIAGLQMAALSMRERDDVAGFIAAFTGDDRYVVDYLVDEVLRRQPEPVRDFLLRTSILDRLSGPLCDAVTGGEDGRRTLAALERGNLFVVPLDDRRHWYRYHHLFADVLRAHATEEEPDRIATLHRRASEWYEASGLRPDAIRHALAAGDVARAAGLVELAALGLLGSSQEATLHGWLAAIPDEVVRGRPVLCAYDAFATLGRGTLEQAEARLRDAERWLDATNDAGDRRGSRAGEMVVVDDEGFAALPGMIAVARAYIAGAVGDVAGMTTQARRAVALVPERNDLWRGAATSILAIGLWTGGDLEAAYHSFAEGKARLQVAGYTQFEVSSVHMLAEIRVAQGRLREAARIYRQGLRLATGQPDPVWGTVSLHAGLSELHGERDELDAATEQLLLSQGLDELGGTPDARHRWYVAMARLREAHGDLDGALDLLDEAERRFVQGADPDLRPFAALRARVWVVQGRLAEAAGWARERGLSAGDDLSYLREFEHVTLARLLLARATRERDDRLAREAIGLLERLLDAADAGERTGSVIEILVILGIAHEVTGDLPRALALLERALALGEPEGYVRTFAAEGETMRTLLRHAAARGVAPRYIRRLLSAVDRAGPASAPGRAAADPAERLTTREVEVVRLIAAGMRNQEIADQLFISLPTVKRHIANAYRKLGVGTRTGAAARASALNLL